MLQATCATQHEKPLDPLVSGKSSLATPLAHSSLKFFLANTDLSSSIDPKQLYVSRTTLSYLTIGKQKVARLAFATDGYSDFVAWKMCPNALSSTCTSGTSLVDEIFFANLVPGSYSIQITPCLTSTTPICGQSTMVTSYFLPDSGQDPISASNAIKNLQDEMQRLTTQIYSLLASDQHIVSACNNMNASHPLLNQDFNHNISVFNIQLQNITSLGQAFLSFTFENGLIQSQDANQLASVAKSLVTKNAATRTGYTPQGLSLTEQDALSKLILPRIFSPGAAANLLNPSHLTVALEGSSGLFSFPASVDSLGTQIPLEVANLTWDNLSEGDQSALASGIFLSMQNQGITKQDSYALSSSLAFNSVLSKDHLLLPLQLDDLGCEGLDQVVADLQTVRLDLLTLEKDREAILGLLAN